MMTVEEVLLKTLETLGHSDLRQFRWRLGKLKVQDGFSPIPWCHLEDADIMKTVDLMVQQYNQQAVEVAKIVLGKMGKNKLVQRLTKRSSEQKDEDIPVPESPEQILQHQWTLQSNLQSRFMCAQEGMADKMDEQCLADIFTELYITAGGEIHIYDQHEVIQIGIPKVKVAEEPIEPCDIFKSPTGKHKPIRTVLTTGIAGIGKTFLVQKFVWDWAERRTNQDVHLIFPFTFRELNLYKTKRFCLAALIQTCIGETKDITEKELTDIFAELQASGNHDFDKSKYKLLFVLDGLDENRHQLNFTENQLDEFDVTQSTSVDVLLTALIKGKLLPSARVWITTRPAAANQIPRDFVDSMSEVRGFTDPQKTEYFRKKFLDEEQANRIISHIKASRTLFIMCHIPVFCWITATVLKDVLKTRTQAELPKTLTEMYTEFLMYHITLTEERYGTEGNHGKEENCGTNETIHCIKSLAKLAFHQLEKGNLVFYEKDLKDSGINLYKAARYSGVFTEVFKEVHKWRKDNDKGKMFSFVHLSLQEYLAALYVVMSLINDNKNVLSAPAITLDSLFMLCKRKSMTEVHEIAINKALAESKWAPGLVPTLPPGPFPAEQSETPYVLVEDDERVLSDRPQDNPVHQRKDQGEHISRQVHQPVLLSGLHLTVIRRKDLEVFDLKKYSASEEGLEKLLPVVKASNKSLLGGCNLSANSCEALVSVLSSPSSKVRVLDLSDNDLYDSGVKSLCAGLESPDCALQILRLSGCMITKEGCAFLASALKSNSSHLRELDLSYNHPGDSGVKLLSAVQKDPQSRLDNLNLDHCGEQRLKPGIKKYVCELTLDKNTAQRNMKLSNDFRKVTTVKELQPYHHTSERFDSWLQVLCSTGLTGRCYWEVECEGRVYIAVTYRGIRRKGAGADRCLGANDHSWMLLCDDDGSYCVRHEDRNTLIRLPSLPAQNRVAVFLDFPAGILSFYKVAADKLIPLHTFKSTFTEPLYPAFGFGFWNGFDCFGSSVSICEVGESASCTKC
ncbi:hypothetical protein L3Q82_000480 [Scortum barcoo]|uniref:Uncharacterized protein n=1 Tax=Scortum barcoo TaxID=214431 RepID=A0ACB8WFI8_9TELE|nr:hypothetical protein L3Q82_000480 [Scortum barcoo]